MKAACDQLQCIPNRNPEANLDTWHYQAEADETTFYSVSVVIASSRTR
ncbi:hypothetical protein ACPOL_4513 [Acidisarcina polymorpha]|uniref:Uncharacterized protein n=1 Tax=Acidisarcina polymorpha TaxID=2211140 RepID=A0A2Z5G548_9BACT|nr:hypothetical protein ACPOL_4513 [Acidisarcina polymorpha]